MNRTHAGANLLALRSHNTTLVLDLLRAAGAEGLSRLELAEKTGLTPQAVSKITARLRDDGLVTQAGQRASTGGKPRTVLRLVPGAGHAVGVHLDRDALRTVLVDLDGTVVAQRRRPVEPGGGAEAVREVVETVAREVEALTGGGESVSRASMAGRESAAGRERVGRASVGRESVGRESSGRGPAGREPSARGPVPVSVLGVGVALPGPLDHVRGVLRRVTGFPGWDGFPLRDALARRLGVPVVVDKDTNAAALGLAARGAGGAVRSFAYLHLGTGLGAGLVVDGVLHRGARTGAGEFGHQVVQLDGPPCECGDRGCVEALCLAAVARGDFREAARVLGTGAANLVGLLDFDLVLLGGRTVAADPEEFLRGVGAVLGARALREGRPGGAVPVRLACDASGGGDTGGRGVAGLGATGPGASTPGEGGEGGEGDGDGERGIAEGAAQLVLAPVFGREA